MMPMPSIESRAVAPRELGSFGVRAGAEELLCANWESCPNQRPVLAVTRKMLLRHRGAGEPLGEPFISPDGSAFCCHRCWVLFCGG